MNFSVKRDFSFIFTYNAFFLLFFLTFLFLTIYSTVAFLIFLIPLVIAILLYDSSVIFASCELNNSILTFRVGLFKYVINTNDITGAELSNNIYPSLALSYERIRIITRQNDKKRIYYVAVKDNKQLLEILQKSIKLENVEEQPLVEDKKVTAVPVEEKETVKAEKKPAAKKTATKKTTTAKKTTTKKSSTAKSSTTAKRSTTTKKTTTKKPATKKTTKTEE